MAIPTRTDAAAGGWSGAAARVQAIPLETWVLGVIVAIGALLRFTTLGSQSYWSDEAATLHQASLSFGSTFSSAVSHEANPPLYFVLTWIWVRLFGSDEFGFRSLSALAGTALIPIAYLAGRELVSKSAGLVAAMLVAVSPFMIWYSQDATEYMTLAALSGASFVYFSRQLRAPSTKNTVGWAVFSALALLIHFFAGFVIAAEAAWLLYRVRRRSVVVATGALVALVGLLAPLALSHTGGAFVGFITETPLRTRIQQVPATFALGTLAKSSLLSYGLVGAAVVTGILIVLLIVGAGSEQLRGAGVAAGVAAFALFVPLLVALAGRDYFIARALIPAWMPLAVVIGAACTARRAVLPGMAFGALVVAGFVYAQVRIDQNSQYQRPDWRGVAQALGSTSAARAVVAYNGSLATDPLTHYLPRARWNVSSQTVLSVDEVDVVANIWQPPPRALPPGTRLLGHTSVGEFAIDRFRVTPAWRLTPSKIALRAGKLVPPAPAYSSVVIQDSAKP
jgi:mannosyltransferase